MRSDTHPAPAQVRRWLEAAAGVRVLVVGDCMLDRYLAGSVERVSPEAPVPVVRVETERAALGGAANVAAGVRALGAGCAVVGVAGEDPAAGELRAALAAAGIPADGLVTDPARPTTVKTRVLARHQQMLRVDREMAAPLDPAVAGRLAERALAELERADALVLEDYDKGTLAPEVGERLLGEARSRGIPSVVDPKLRHFFAFRGATLFKPNGRELAAALGVERAPRDGESLRRVAERLACDHLLLTLGEEGMLLLSRGAGTPPARIPSRAREVFDVTGAGDTVTATLAVLLAAGAGVTEAAAVANRAAGLEVSRLGAVPVTQEELLADLDREARGPAPDG